MSTFPGQYTAAQIEDVRSNCPRCCGLPFPSPPPPPAATCADENAAGWLDAQGYSCSDWQTYLCVISTFP
eukprot:6033748-Prymnesium_polylepis.1